MRHRPFRTFDRYQRVYHGPSQQYLNVLGPGTSGNTLLVADAHASFIASRDCLRPLRWYERLLNR